MEEQSFLSFMGNNLADFWEYTGFAQATGQHLIMILVGLFFLFLAIKKNFEPLLLVPIGFGILIGNIPFKADAGLEIGIYEEGSVLNILYQNPEAKFEDVVKSAVTQNDENGVKGNDKFDIADIEL